MCSRTNQAINGCFFILIKLKFEVCFIPSIYLFSIVYLFPLFYLFPSVFLTLFVAPLHQWEGEGEEVGVLQYHLDHQYLDHLDHHNLLEHLADLVVGEEERERVLTLN